MKKTFKLNSPKATEECARALAEELDSRGIKRAFIALFGEMGVGKTAFSRGFASYFGINTVKSPTYTVLNEYRGRCAIHHFDFYRITDEDDLYSIGYDDVVESDGYCLGEWSENIEAMLPEDAIRVTIKRERFDTEATEQELMLRDVEIDYGELFD
jgi:tRNA threonylcarbamoyladenosine biosynthesis protein TsaE